MQTGFNKHVYQILMSVAVATIALGTIVYHYAESLPWVDAYYFSVVTLATVGYGDISPKTTFGKLFTTLYILIGVGIISAFITQFAKRQAVRVEQRNKAKDESSE